MYIHIFYTRIPFFLFCNLNFKIMELYVIAKQHIYKNIDQRSLTFIEIKQDFIFLYILMYDVLTYKKYFNFFFLHFV